MTLNLAEATKKLKAEKQRENYLKVQIDGTFILPHKAGVALLEALGQAERGPTYQNSYQITELDQYSVQTMQMSWRDYDRYKLAAILNVKYDDIVAAENAAKQESQPTP